MFRSLIMGLSLFISNAHAEENAAELAGNIANESTVCTAEQNQKFETGIIPEVVVCNDDMIPYVEAAVEYWTDKGHPIKFDKESKCDFPTADHIYGKIVVNYDPVSVKNTSAAMGGALSAYTQIYNVFGFDDILFYTDIRMDYPKKNLDGLIIDFGNLTMIHEMGHAIGFDHVDESCEGHVMHPILQGMGLEFNK